MVRGAGCKDGGRTVFEGHACAKDHEAVCHWEDGLDVVGDDHDGSVLVRQLAQDGEAFVRGLRVKAVGRLVGQNELRAAHGGKCGEYSPGHSARKLKGKPLGYRGSQRESLKGIEDGMPRRGVSVSACCSGQLVAYPSQRIEGAYRLGNEGHVAAAEAANFIGCKVATMKEDGP
jgi:hypothetical protein